MTEPAVDAWRPARAVFVAAFALVLLFLTLFSAYGHVPGPAVAALVLPAVLTPTLIAGAAVGVLAVGRFAAGAGVRGRLLYGALGGLPVGLLAMGGMLMAYHSGPSVAYVAVTVAVAGALGGLAAAAHPVSAVAAGAAGGVLASAIGLLVAYFQNDLVDLFGNEETVGSMADASYRLQLTGSIVGGIAAGALAFGYLRRTGLALPWPTYPFAGAIPGLLTLGAALIGWIGGLPLSSAVAKESEFDAAIIANRLPEQVNHGLILLFAGAFVAMILVGRTIKRS
ncbi:hypothetical protein [Dactylosporangium matsuzakiense]|uniref:Uncharacterized protein n=1 Tax=Dactylosporangium matsuzakiense TaxID=53360 RepID=A0A9W6NKY8_9ACTN|nr:hypothetical protein [Dactylosporangium matsuzakiense]UWZ44097.1 hypothetical protein Dmats_43000 [Dactylosporangium matsuzakiense]GLL00794.1 hypothetical protein GCM10017581_025350 [Dactylosporangium matsuzakiense]